MTLTLVKQEVLKLPDLSPVLIAQQEFHGAFNIPLNEAMQELYVKLIDEEHEEWIEEYYKDTAPHYKELKELADVVYTVAGLAFQLDWKQSEDPVFGRRIKFDDSITDYVSDIITGSSTPEVINCLFYCLFAYAEVRGWDLMEAYKRVHKSNMSKLGDDGKPIYREDGKVMKGPNYQPPYLKDLTNEEQSH